MKYITPNWPAPDHVKAYTTTRLGWGDTVSRADKAASIEQLTTLLELPNTPIWLTQHHGINVVDAALSERGTEADASFSHAAQEVCMIETADCLPVIICNRQGTRVAAIHAGWRGLVNGIIEATLQKLAQPSDELLVWLGPAIGPTKFEVGRDVYEAFVSKHAEAKNAFIPRTQTTCTGYDEKWLANLYDLARLRLNLQGVTQIYGGDYCTHSQPDLFYSYRREGAGTGRMASVVFLSS